MFEIDIFLIDFKKGFELDIKPTLKSYNFY